MRTPSELGLQSAPITARSLSRLAQGMVGSEVLRISGEVRAVVASGREVLNLTVGDFDPREFPLPKKLAEGVKAALDAGHSNYPPSNGILELRKAVVGFYEREMQLEYPLESVIIAGGARPLIYAAFKTLVDVGDGVVFPVPSWNNNHYVYLCGGRSIPLEVSREHRFHPTPEQIAAVLPGARLLSLSSPLNPTGTGIEPGVLAAISQQVVDENRRRERTGARPLFMMFDQVYWATAFDTGMPVTPPALVPEVAPYTVLIDAISKSLAATGLRVGWALAHPAVTARMSDLLGHVGAWAPKPEQVATAAFIADPAAFHEFRGQMAVRLRARLEALHDGLMSMRARGLPVEAVEPEGTLYLSARFALGGTVRGRQLATNEDVRKLLLEEAGVAAVPFQAFALPHEDGWFRLSVGAVSVPAIEQGLGRLEQVLAEATAR
ncbi:MAG TPA: aminotransferase class I/II-fold pyridoxal phosphate-dependent enzyme [Candidatus Eisenbacteria bacterium]